MNANRLRPLLCLAALAALSASAGESRSWFVGDDATVFPLLSHGTYDTWLRDRLSVGLEFSFSSLTDAKRSADKGSDKTFVGFINELDDDDEFGVFPSVSYWAADYVRLTLFRDSVAGRTRNYNTENHHSDGVVKAAGPALLVEGLYPMRGDTVFLHAGLGLSWAFGDFEEDGWWHLGYSSEASWREYGSPGTKAGDHYREIEVDDSVGILLAAGVAWRPVPRMELDFSLRHTWLEPDCKFGYRRRSGFEVRDTGEFTLDHLTAALTVSWVF